MMLVLAVKMKVKTDKKEEFFENAQVIIEASNQEDGCITYRAYEDFMEPNTFIFYEEWRSEEDWNKHMMTPHVKGFNEILPDLIEGDVDGKIHTVTYSRPL